MGDQKTISFRMEAAKVATLDEIAVETHRDRTFLLNEAVDAWLDLHAYQQRLVETGMKAAREGRYIGPSEMRKQLSKLKKKHTTV